MQKQFVIDCDSDSEFIHIFEAQKSYRLGAVVYERDPATSSLMCGRISNDSAPRTYGRLHALLFSSETLEEAAPIVPEKISA